MNYYIQGNKERAKEIKAAFEKLGYDVTGFDMCNDNILFFTYKLQTGANVISTTNAHLYTANIIKTHPDYKELELPVRPKFKIGDWIACDADSFTLSIKSVRDVNYYFHQGESLPIKYIDEHYHLWSIADAKDSDIIGFNDCTHKDGSYIDWVGIYKHQSNDFVNHQHLFHCVATNKNTFRIGGSWRVFAAYPATKEQRDLLFKKMKEAGYQWDAEKKELRKIEPHYDISNFKPFDKVLTRDTEGGKWNVNLFSYYIYDEDARVVAHFRCMNSLWKQCIPFNDDTKHLLGTTDMPDECYINW